MGKLSVFADTAKSFVIKRSPEILTGVGITGMVTTTILAVKATPKAMRIIEQKEAEAEERLKPVEVVKCTWKCYIPAAITGTISIACLIGASSVSSKRNALLATAYSLSERTLKEYKEAVVETVGEKKEQAVRERVAEKKLENDPVTKHDVIITSEGDTLCYDSIGGRYFRSSVNKIRKAENEVNNKMLHEIYASLNDFYYNLGIDGTDLGERLGWNANDRTKLVEIYITAKVADNDEPCLVIDYSRPPEYDYDILG